MTMRMMIKHVELGNTQVGILAIVVLLSHQALITPTTEHVIGVVIADTIEMGILV